MHTDLVMYWIRIAALIISPIAPHFSEHIYSTVLKSPTSIQRALWPTPSAPVDVAVIESAVYMRGTTKTIRDAEATLVKMLNKSKGKGPKDGKPLYDPKKPKSVRVYVATAFPEWQESCVQVVKESYDAAANKVDDAKVRALLTERSLIKDKRAMPFVQDFKV
jgi:leucyl-tRNA synthetase